MELHANDARHHAQPALAVLAALLGAACSAPRLPPECIIDIDVLVHDEAMDEVDLLLMIDDSGSMAGEQALLVAELPRMMQMLAAGERGRPRSTRPSSPGGSGQADDADGRV